ncbi:MAG TPA: hypothetical protein PKK60_03470, partial [archaeon]|nr:hypothetical protein [archaeon]
EESIYGNSKENPTEEKEDDLFTEAFGEDEEKKAAKEKMRKHAEELKKHKDQKESKENNENKNDDEYDDKNNNDKNDEDDDDGDEVEEEGESNVEPEIFGEISEENEEKIKKKIGYKEPEIKTMEDTLTEQDNGTPIIHGEDEEDIIGKNLKKSIKSVNEENEKEDKEESEKEESEKSSDGEEDAEENEDKKNDEEKNEETNKDKNNKINKKKSTTGKLDLKVTMEEDEEEEDIGIENPIERNVIKSVIRNKAQKAIKDSDHDEMAETMLREEGTIDSDEIKRIDEDLTALQNQQEHTEEESEDNTDSSSIKPKLEFLTSDKGHAYIGRKKSVLSKYGEEAGLFIGRVQEKDSEGKDVYLDGLNPHVVFVCGARGSGKSYVLGVVAEEMAIKNKNVGIVVVDPIGVFWSMKHPNKEEKELELLAKWDLMPRGLDNVKVFIPVGMKSSVPKSTYDSVFSIQPALLTAEDWCLTFGIDRFSPTGLLMEKGISKVKAGYVTSEGKPVRGKQNTFSLEDLIMCFDSDSELNDKDRGYKSDSIRALASRFDAAKHWGIFDEKGTPLSQLSKAGQMTILDTSFLEDNVSALVIGIFARRLLSARKLSTRREAAGKFADTTMEDLVELNVPPTWLFIDEAHTLIPGGNQKTPASNALVEYVKQGRRPGCSLVFATQQPSAIDTKVLSQLDVIMAHKLVFDDDIKSIHKRTPAIIPHQYKKPNFIKTMPVGIALTGDRQETTTRAFIMSIRPRMSQHEGRDAETTEQVQELAEDQVEILAVNITARQLEKDPKIAIETLAQTLETLNNTYKKKVELEKIIKMLEKKGITQDENYLYAQGVKEEEEAAKKAEEEGIEGEESKEEAELNKLKTKKPKSEEEIDFEQSVELTAIQSTIEEKEARVLLAKHRLKKTLGLFGEEEILDRLSQKYGLIYKIKYHYFTQKDAYRMGEAYVNSISGEFIHDDNGKIVESTGLKLINELNESEATLFGQLIKKKTLKELANKISMEEGNTKRILDELIKKKIVTESIFNNEKYYILKQNVDLPKTPLHEILPSIGKRPIMEVEGISVVPPKLDETELPELLHKLWGNIKVKEVTHLFLPLWEGVLKKKTGEERTIIIDAINGKKIS